MEADNQALQNEPVVAEGSPQSQPSPIDAKSLTPHQLNLLAMQGNRPVPVQEASVDVATGRVLTHVPEVAEIPVAEEPETPESAQETVAAPVEPAEMSFDDEVDRFLAGDKRTRLGQISREDAKAIIYRRRNPDSGDLLDAYAKVNGKDAVLAKFGLATPAATETPAPEAPAASELDTIEAEMAALEDQIAEAKSNYDVETEAKLDKEWRAMQRKATKLSREAAKEAKAPEPARETPAALPGVPDYQARFNADWQKLLAQDAALAEPEERSPILGKMRSVHERLVAEDSPALYVLDAKGNRIGDNPEINSVCYKMAKAELNIAPKQRTATAPPATRGVPGPATAAPRQSPVQAPRVDPAQWARQLTPHQLQRLVARPA